MIIDTHCDTLTKIFNHKLKLYENNLHVDIKRLKNFHGFCQIFACFIDPEYKACAKQYALDAFSYFKTELINNKSHIEQFTTFSEYKRIISEKKIAAIFSIEGGEAIETLSDIDLFYNLGVRIITLTWNHDNKIASGVLGNSDFGVTDFGKSVIDKMSDLKMIVDVSHISEKAFWEVSDISKMPIIATHSDAYKICQNPRNLTDEQFLEIKRQNGYVGINLYPEFLTNKGHAKISDVLKTTEHFLALGGENIIGLGCDFDGVDSLPDGISDVSDLEKIFNEMSKAGYSSELIDKIAHKNFEKILNLFWNDEKNFLQFKPIYSIIYVLLFTKNERNGK